MSNTDVTAYVLTIIGNDFLEFLPLIFGLASISYVVFLLLRFTNPTDKF